MRKCLETCRSLNTSCPVEDCKYWIEYDKDFNCTLESIERNGNMTLRQVAERIGVSFVRIKQIEDKALKKIGHLFEKESI